jgi:hypothetical protein
LKDNPKPHQNHDHDVSAWPTLTIPAQDGTDDANAIH